MGSKGSPSRKEKYARQKQRTVENKQRKLLKHLKNQPNDKQAEKALS